MAGVPPVGAAAGGVIHLGRDLTVNRLGFGAMRITGPGILGEPPDRAQATAVLRRAVELGVNFIDTADSYGPHVSENLIAEALAPLPAGPGAGHQGWSGTPRSRPVDSERPPGAPPPGLRRQPPPVAARPDTALPVPPARPRRPARRVDRRPGRAAGGGQDPPSRAVQRHRGAAGRGPADHGRRLGPESLQRPRPPLGGPGRPLPARRPGVPAVGPDQGDRGRPRRRPPSPASTEPLPPRWPWPGCCSARRRCCRSPAPAPWPTSRRTSPPPASTCPPGGGGDHRRAGDGRLS